MGEIDRGAIYLALGSRSSVKGVEALPIGGRTVTPEEEVRMGEQLQRELDDYKRPLLEARARVFQAMSGKPTYSIED